MNEYGYIIEVIGPVPMPEQIEKDAYQAINDVYKTARDLGQVPLDVQRVVEVGNVAVVPASQGMFKHRIGWYVRDPSGLPIVTSPYLLPRELTPVDFHE